MMEAHAIFYAVCSWSLQRVSLVEIEMALVNMSCATANLFCVFPKKAVVSWTVYTVLVHGLASVPNKLSSPPPCQLINKVHIVTQTKERRCSDCEDLQSLFPPPFFSSFFFVLALHLEIIGSGRVKPTSS